MSVTARLLAVLHGYHAALEQTPVADAARPDRRPTRGAINAANVDGWYNPVVDAIARHGGR